MNHSSIAKLMRPSLASAAVALALGGHAGVASAYDTNPPTWMPMVMSQISLGANGGLQMPDQNTFTPRCPSWSSSCFSSSPLPLTLGVFSNGNPNLAATTFAQWDPSQPWAVLQNMAFSREFGWWGGSGTAPATLKSSIETTYGAGASIWIEVLSQTAGLETYKAVGKYGVNANNTATVDPLAGGYTGIFGTAGSATKWQWDYMMDHNIYAVDLNATNGWGKTFTATYNVYVGDMYGNELAAAAGKNTIETWAWAAPVPEPETYAMLLAGLGLMGTIARRRRNASKA